jgi:hypothetical protein
VISKVFSIYDTKAESFCLPFYKQTKGLAIRDFTDACNDPKSPWSKYPSEFLLYEIGEFDDSTAIMINYEQNILIGHGSDFVQV